MSELPVAFLIMAHADPAMLARLVRRIYDPASTYVVHINVRTDIAPFVALFRGMDNVHFVPDEQRVAVNWAGFSFTAAVLAAVDHAIRIRSDTSRFVLLSGADYAIKPLDHILAEVRKDQEIMTISREIDPRGMGFHNGLAQRFYLGDYKLFNVRTGPWLLRKSGSAFNRFGPRRGRYPLQIFHGASWWSLTRAAIDIIQSKRGTPFVDWFRLSQLPDETMPQTLLMHSPRRDFIKYNQLTGIGELDYERGINGPHYADWRNPNPHLPRHLEAGDFEAVMASEALFMRKVDSVRSAPLLDLVDRALG